MKTPLKSMLVLCDLDRLLLRADGALPQGTRDVVRLFLSRGGNLTVFSQRSPKAVGTLLNGIRLAAPALLCGGTLVYQFSDGSAKTLSSFAGREDTVLKKLPSAVGLGIALQMRDGLTRVLRMSEALERHLRYEHTPYILTSAADSRGEDVLRVLLYQDQKQLPLELLLERTLGAELHSLRVERIAVDTIALTTAEVPGDAMLQAVCEPTEWTEQQVLVLADCPQMLALVRLAGDSAVPADASAEMRVVAARTTVTDHDGGAAAEVLYDLVRRAEIAG